MPEDVRAGDGLNVRTPDAGVDEPQSVYDDGADVARAHFALCWIVTVTVWVSLVDVSTAVVEVVGPTSNVQVGEASLSGLAGLAVIAGPAGGDAWARVGAATRRVPNHAASTTSARPLRERARQTCARCAVSFIGRAPRLDPYGRVC